MAYRLVEPSAPPPRRYRLIGPPAPSVGVGEDMLKSAGAGLVRGAAGLAGLPGDVEGLVGSGVRWAGDKLGLEPNAAPKQFFPTSQELRSSIEDDITGPLYEPQTTAGKYASTVAEFAPGVALPGGGLVRRGVQTLAAGLGSEAAGQATEGTAFEPYARAAGAIAGGIAPAMGARVVTPLPISAERKAMVDALRKEDVYPTAGQVTGRDKLQYFESELGGAKTKRIRDATDDQFTAAVLRRVGETATRATPEVMDRAFTRIGKQFDDLAARASVPLDPKLQNDILGVVTDYQAIAGTPAPALEQMMNRIADVAAKNGGVLQGEAYQNIRSKMGEWIANADGPTKNALREMQGALDDAVGRHISAADKAAWNEARSQYKNLMVVKDAATGAGEAAALGAISPAKLRQSAASGPRRSGYVRGKGDFSELAHAGQAIMTPLPQSGTAPRLAVRGVMGLPAVVGGMAGGSMGGAMEAGAGMLAGAAVPFLAGRAAMFSPIQGYLKNQSFAGAANMTEQAKRAALIEAMMVPRQLTSQ